MAIRLRQLKNVYYVFQILQTLIVTVNATTIFRVVQYV